MRYAIFEGNLPRLEKKLKTIVNKSKNFNGFSFNYKIIGEEFRKNGCEILRYVIVEANGFVKLDNWRFVATLDHTENGNVIRAIEQMEIPTNFYGNQPICEHCKTQRFRKNTYIVFNEHTKEFKQVGKTCLLDFTGINVETIVNYYSLFDALIEGEAFDSHEKAVDYIKTSELMLYYAETVRKFGYVSRNNTNNFNSMTTVDRGVALYYLIVRNKAFDYQTRDYLLNEIERVCFNATSDGAVSDVQAAIKWLENQPNNNYIHNLKTVTGLEYITYKHFGILASLFGSFKQQKGKAEDATVLESKHVGDIGERISVKVKNVKLLNSWDGNFGMTYMFKIFDEAGNVYIWKTSKYIDNCTTIVGTVKSHTEFNKVHQTELTRCKIFV